MVIVSKLESPFCWVLCCSMLGLEHIIQDVSILSQAYLSSVGAILPTGCIASQSTFQMPRLQSVAMEYAAMAGE